MQYATSRDGNAGIIIERERERNPSASRSRQNNRRVPNANRKTVKPGKQEERIRKPTSQVARHNNSQKQEKEKDSISLANPFSVLSD